MKHTDHKGFSLVELIVVIAIMAVLVGVLAPALLHYVEKSRIQRDASAVSEVVEAERIALMDGDIFDMVAVNNKVTISAAGEISDDLAAPNAGALADEIKNVIPSVNFASPNKGDVEIKITSLGGSPAFAVTTTSTDTDWKSAIEAVE